MVFLVKYNTSRIDQIDMMKIDYQKAVSRQGSTVELLHTKVGCVFLMVVVSILPHAEFGVIIEKAHLTLHEK